MRAGKVFNLLMLAAVLASCQHQQDFCYDHSGHDRKPVEVVFDWTECPDAEPDGMCLYLFPVTDSANPKRFDFKGNKGGTIKTRPGIYTAIALNSGIENTAVRYSTVAETFELWLRGSFTKNGDGLCNPSDMVWIGVSENIDVDGGTIRLLMRETVCRCEVDVRHLTNHNKLRSASARLSGFNEAISAIGRVGAAGSVNICFDMERDTATSLHAELFTLGHCGRARSREGEKQTTDQRHTLSIGFTLSDGSTWVYKEDVSEQVHAQPDEYCHIVIDSIELPNTASSGGGGFEVNVEDWETFEFTIKP